MTTKNYFLHIQLTVWLTAVLVGLSACDKELEKFPQDQFAKETFWTDESAAKIALTGVYRGAIAYGNQENPTDWWSYAGIVFTEIATDNAFDRQGDNSEFNRLSNGTLLPNNGVIYGYWVGSFKRIAICNDFLENVSRVTMAETNKKRMMAEVRFIRACQYFYMSQHWGSVPLVTTTLTPEKANQVTREPKAKVVQFVESELKEAIADLPRFKDITATETGRASKQAAMAFLGRLYLSENKYAEASALYKQIIDFGDNLIDPNYQTLFFQSNENSKENIFSTQYFSGLAGNGLPLQVFPEIAGGFTKINPLGNLAEAYEFSDGTPFSFKDPRYNPNDVGANRDPRLGFTLLWEGKTFQGKTYLSNPDSPNQRDKVSYNSTSSRTGFVSKKFSDEGFVGDLSTGYGGNIPIIRYAEVLLSYLEAELEAGRPIDQSLLDLTINKVRGRQSVKLPPITDTNPATLRPLLRRERRVELALEGIRYWDLLRWKIADQVLNADFWGNAFPNSKSYATGTKKIDPNFRWWVTSRSFRKGQDELWPIPQAEVSINPNLAK
ncbi:RagB/SusD family nutrient uptake outer membrane protein [Spirosoma areae]